MWFLLSISIYSIYKAKMSVYLSTHQLSIVDLQAKPMAWNQQVPADVLAWF